MKNRPDEIIAACTRMPRPISAQRLEMLQFCGLHVGRLDAAHILSVERSICLSHLAPEYRGTLLIKNAPPPPRTTVGA